MCRLGWSLMTITMRVESFLMVLFWAPLVSEGRNGLFMADFHSRVSLDQSSDALLPSCTNALTEGYLAWCWNELVRTLISHLSQGEFLFHSAFWNILQWQPHRLYVLQTEKSGKKHTRLTCVR